MSRDLGARSGRPRTDYQSMRRAELPTLIRKEDAACCNARRDDLGRLPIGFCSPECVRRPVRHG